MTGAVLSCIRRLPRPRSYLLLGLCAFLPFACRTQDPRPGLGHSGGSTGNGASLGDAGHSSASGGVDFGVGEGGTNGTGSATNGEGGMGSGTGGNAGPGPGPSSQCGAPPVSDQAFSKQALLESAGACSAYQACLFSEAAFELGRQVTLYADAPTPARLEAARAAWIDAVIVWSEIAPSRFGPVASVTKDSYHGRGLGGLIHIWPSLNRCEVEKQVVNRGYEQGFEAVVPSARGLSALEYLLFYEGLDTECSPNSGAAKAWALLSAGEVAAAKRAYAKSLVQDVYLRAEELVNVWAAEGEDFGETLANHEGYGTQQEALNVVAWSLLYPYDSVRDIKVAPRAGIGTTTANDMSPYAHVDLEGVVANMDAFRALYQGCGEDGAGIGFDDWLLAAGADALARDIELSLDDIDARAAALPPLHLASTEEMAAFYADLKVLSDLLKAQFFGSGSVLNLKLPDGVASDTD